MFQKCFSFDIISVGVLLFCQKYIHIKLISFNNFTEKYVQTTKVVDVSYYVFIHINKHCSVKCFIQLLIYLIRVPACTHICHIIYVYILYKHNLLL